MNGPMLASLCKEAFYQVLDNKVFRVLLVLVLIPILCTLIFGFREDEIIFLFGVKRWGYGGLLDFFTASVGSRFGQDDPQTLVINGFSGIVIEGLAGKFGVIFTIAATAFFVPRMIEKGAADVLFHKPLSRLAFYLSRYFAGLVFIALFSAFLVGGMYLGFLLVSGYNDPGILWAALTLTYAFGLIHGVSMLVGVLTRSTVAAILLSMIFFLFNGCIHQVWIQVEQGRAKEEAAREVDRAAREKEESAAPSDAGDPAQAEQATEEEEDDEPPAFVRLMLLTLDTAHYIGPKTTDADYITARLRAAVEGEDPFLDPESKLAVLELKGGLVAGEAAGLAVPVPGAGAVFGKPVFHAADGGGRSLAIWARARRELERESASRKRVYLEDGGDAADELEPLLAALGAADVARERVQLGDDSRIVAMAPVFIATRPTAVSWTADGRRTEALLFGYRDRFHAVVLETPANLTAEERDAWRKDVLSECGVIYEEGRTDWYGSRLGWTSELKFNLFFSLGSSFAFTVLVLFLGWWRLSRIDF